MSTRTPRARRRLDSQRPRRPSSRSAAGELTTLLDTAAAFKTVGTREIKKVPALRGQTMVNFFVEPSTRTRVTFELAAHRLSADVINVSASVFQPHQRRDAQGHRAQSRGASRRHHRPPPQLRRRGAVPRRAARRPASSMPATARTSIPRRRCSTPSPSAKSSAASPASTSPSSATSSSAASPARTSTRCSSSARASPSSARARSSRASSSTSASPSPTISTPCCPSADVVNLLRIQHERQRKEYFPSLGEYTALFGLTKAARRAAQTRRAHHAPRPDQSRRRDRQRPRRQRPQRHPRSGHQRPRRPHGRPLPLRRRRGATSS